MDSVSAKAVGVARRSGSSSWGSSGTGDGSLGGGVGSRFCRTGYFRRVGLGVMFSLTSLGLVNRSNGLDVPLGVSVGA